MIASPCKNCPNRHLPKEICLASCKILCQLQTMNAVNRRECCEAVDYADDNRYRVASPSVTSSDFTAAIGI